MACSDSQIDKPQRGHPKRAELLDVHINTGAQSINTESFFDKFGFAGCKQKQGSGRDEPRAEGEGERERDAR